MASNRSNNLSSWDPDAGWVCGVLRTLERIRPLVGGTAHCGSGSTYGATAPVRRHASASQHGSIDQSRNVHLAEDRATSAPRLTPASRMPRLQHPVRRERARGGNSALPGALHSAVLRALLLTRGGAAASTTARPLAGDTDNGHLNVDGVCVTWCERPLRAVCPHAPHSLHLTSSWRCTDDEDNDEDDDELMWTWGGHEVGSWTAATLLLASPPARCAASARTRQLDINIQALAWVTRLRRLDLSSPAGRAPRQAPSTS
jgi:hypothetical protein